LNQLNNTLQQIQQTLQSIDTTLKKINEWKEIEYLQKTTTQKENEGYIEE